MNKIFGDNLNSLKLWISISLNSSSNLLNRKIIPLICFESRIVRFINKGKRFALKLDDEKEKSISCIWLFSAFILKNVQITVIALAAWASAAPAEEPIPIVSQSQDGPNPDGSYKWQYESGNGIKAEEEGLLANAGSENEAVQAKGSYSYKDDQGKEISLTYTANEEGFQPVGDHLPVAPEIPPLIQKALEWNAAHPSKEDEPKWI